MLLIKEENREVVYSFDKAVVAASGDYVTALGGDDKRLTTRPEKPESETCDQENVLVSDTVTKCFDKDRELQLWKMIDMLPLLDRKKNVTVTCGQFLEASAPVIPTSTIQCYDVKSRWLTISTCILSPFIMGQILNEAYYLYRLTPNSVLCKVKPDLLAVHDKWTCDPRASEAERKILGSLRKKGLKCGAKEAKRVDQGQKIRGCVFPHWV